MRRTAVIFTIALAFLASPQIVAAQPHAACGLAGSWIGSTGGIFMLATYADVQNKLSGTLSIDLTGDATFGGAFPLAVRWTSGRGAWVRTGIGIYDYVFFGAGLAADNTIVYHVKTSGTKTISGDCRTQTFSTTLEFFFPWQDPMMDAPFYATPGAPGVATRIVAER